VWVSAEASPSIFFAHHIMNLLIANTIVPETQRLEVVDRLFGVHYALKIEPTIFNMAGHLAPAYDGAYWMFHILGNGGFYMAPRTDTIYAVRAENGYEGMLSADALGITACLYAYSHLSFGQGRLAEVCAEHHHLLRAYLFEHQEVRAILQAID
jgi:hypothetical protein